MSRRNELRSLAIACLAADMGRGSRVVVEDHKIQMVEHDLIANVQVPDVNPKARKRGGGKRKRRHRDIGWG